MTTATETTGHLLTARELADALDVPVQRLYGWRSRGQGPTSTTIKQAVVYDVDTVNEWLSQGSE